MQNYDLELVRDSRIQDIKDKVVVPVYQGAGRSTYNIINANSKSSSNIMFQFQPTQSNCVARDMKIYCRVKFQLAITNVPVGQNAFDYGNRDSLQSYPLSRLFTNIVASINGGFSNNQNVQELLPVLVRVMDPEYVQYNQNYTPVYPDNYQRYSDCLGKSDNPLSADTSLNKKFKGRGTHPLYACTIARTPFGGGPVDAVNVSANVGDSWIISITVELIESLFLGPFKYDNNDDGSSNACLLGVDNVSLNINIDTQLRRFWSTGCPGTVAISFQNDPFEEAQLFVEYLTVQPTYPLKTMNTLEYKFYQKYITGSANLGVINAGANGTVTINSLNWSTIPERIYIFVRKSLGDQTVKDTDTFWKINNLSIQFNNQSGLLSSYNAMELYNMSKHNGSNMSYDDFVGNSAVYNGGYAGVAPYALTVKRAGTFIVINPARDLNLSPEVSNLSQGMFTFSCTVNVTNPDVANLTPECVIFTRETRLLSLTPGNAMQTSSLLNMQMVTSTTIDQQGKPDMEGEMSGGSMYLNKKLKDNNKRGGARSGGACGQARGPLKELCF